MSFQIQRVVIVGGTHGNELTGIYLVKKFRRYPHLLKRKSFEAQTLLANTQAIAANRRFISRDLNRCFGADDLANPFLASYEEQRAKEIAAQLTPESSSNVEVIIDVHSTTSNMGFTIIPSVSSPLILRLAAYLRTLNPLVRVCLGMQSNQETSVLRSLSPLGFTLEVGPIPQGVLNAYYLQQTEKLVHGILDYLDALNYGNLLPVHPSLTMYQMVSCVDYPRDLSGELDALIHPRLQSRDYKPLNHGEPMFLKLTGESVPYLVRDTVCPIFINEAAYYDKQIAMILTHKHLLSFESETHSR
jgi:succinylglutamate desuccinylase